MGLLTKAREVKALNTNLTYSSSIVNGGFSSHGDRSETYIDNGYKTLPNLYGIISLITQKSTLPPYQIMKIKNRGKFKEYKARLKALKFPAGNKNAQMLFNAQLRKLFKTKEEAFEEVENTGIDMLFEKPNPRESIEELNEAHDAYLLLTGNGYFQGDTPGIGVNRDIPNELYAPPAPMVEIVAKGLDIKEYKIAYFNEPLDVSRIGHSKYFNPISGSDSPVNQLKGMSPLLSCRNLLKRYASADIAQGAMFKNMGPLGILNGEAGELTQEQATAVQDRFDQTRTGTANAGKIAVSSSRMHWTQIGLSPVDLNTIEGKKEILGELCNVFHVPIGLFSDENSTDNNMDNSRRMFITDAVIPLCEKRKQTLNKWLAPKFGNDLYIEYDYSIFPEMQEDLKEQAETAAIMWWTSPNEKREMTTYEIDASPAMNKYYIPSGLMPIEDSSLAIEDVDEELLSDEDK